MLRISRDEMRTICIQYRGNMCSSSASNSEVFASELLEKLEKCSLCTTCIVTCLACYVQIL